MLVSLRETIAWEIVKSNESLAAVDSGSMNDIIDSVLRAISSANMVVVDSDHYSTLNEAYRAGSKLLGWEEFE